MKIAILIVGQKRCFDTLYEHIYANVKDICSVSDIFICVDDSPKQSIDPNIIDMFKPKDVLYYDANANMHKCRSNNWGFQAAFGIYTAYNSILNSEKTQGYPYDLIVKLRPDVYMDACFRITEDDTNAMIIDLTKFQVHTQYLGGANTDPTHPRKCLDDIWSVITRPAFDSFAVNHYNNYLDNTFGHVLHLCPECKLGATLSNDNVDKLAFPITYSIIRNCKHIIALNRPAKVVNLYIK
jgi:hypothetical protein